jgi:hypothetical protein
MLHEAGGVNVLLMRVVAGRSTETSHVYAFKVALSIGLASGR